MTNKRGEILQISTRSTILGLVYIHSNSKGHRLELITDTVTEALNTYLSGTRLSMDQVAKKWNISTAMLSQVKNGKKRAGVDLGLKILRESGTDIESRRNWLEHRYLSESEEYSLVHNEIKRKKVEKNLQSEFCELLENEPALLDIFLDIALAEEAGVSWNAIFKHYGEYGTELATSLVESGTVSLVENRYKINQENSTFISDELTSFGIVKAIIEAQRTRKKREQFRGELQYDVTDVSPEAYEELINLNKEYVKQVRSILEDHEKHRLTGGVRVVCQSLVALAKGSLCLLLLLTLGSFSIDDSYAGGLRGGSSDKTLGGISGGSSDLKARLRKPRDIHHRGEVFKFKESKLRIPHVFETKRQAIEEMVALNLRLAMGEVPKGFQHRFTMFHADECRDKHNVTAAMRVLGNKASIKAISFQVHESYNGEGQERFTVSADYYVPCQKKKKN